MVMEYDAQLKLQSYFDGELPEAEAREVANWLARDREAMALFGELRNTRQAFVGLEVGVELPESREFFWSKVEREIRRQGEPGPVARPIGLLSAWRRFLVPAGAVAALAVAAMIGLHSGSGVSTVETAVADTAAFTYHDFSSGTTLVWFSYPAENDVAEGAQAGKVQ
jgi:anti-sigma factor RsiW